MTQSNTKPIQAELREAKPKSLHAYSSLFNCPINFLSDSNSLIFNKDELLKPLPTADAHLAVVHEQHLQQYRDRRATLTMSDKVERILVAMLPSGEPKQGDVAAQLNLSSSTLKRRLNDEGNTFKSLLDNLRHELAIKYLNQDKLSITETTYLLGFSQSSAFTRAFKRWEGVSPKQRNMRKV